MGFSALTRLLALTVLMMFLSLRGRAQSLPPELRCQNQVASQVRVLTYNILTSDNVFSTGPWALRLPRIAQLIHAQIPDLFGVQEALPSMMDGLSAELPEYASTGVGREDGHRQGEFSAIFYRKDRLELLQSETFWLSETPHIPGKIGWDARCPRIVTWALFRDRRRGKVFYAFNTHFDHIGQKARENSARLLAAATRELSRGRPAVVMGDFNAAEDSPVHRLFLKESGYVDAITRVKNEGPRWTFSFYGLAKSKIDFIFVDPAVRVCRHAILPENPFSLIQRSDHLPVTALLEFP